MTTVLHPDPRVTGTYSGAEVAAMFGVSIKTPRKWANRGLLTLAGPDRYYRTEVDTLRWPLPQRTPGAALDAIERGQS